MTARRISAMGERLRTAWLFCLLFILLPLAYLNGVQQPEIALKMPLLAAGLGLYIVWTAFSGHPVIRLSDLRSPPVAALLFLLVWQCAGLVYSVNAGDASLEMARFSVQVVLLLVLTGLFSTHPHLQKIFAAGPTLAVLTTSVYGLIQLVILRNDSIAKGIPFVVNFAIGSSLGNKNSFAEVLLLCLP